MTNTNCLEDFRCPACGYTESFRLVATCVIKLYDSGIEDSEEFEWEDRNWCQCCNCGHDGSVSDFSIKNQNRISEDDKLSKEIRRMFELAQKAGLSLNLQPETIGVTKDKLLVFSYSSEDPLTLVQKINEYLEKDHVS